MGLKECNSLKDLRKVIDESSEDNIYQLWKSGELRKKTAELKCSDELAKLDNINMNVSKTLIIRQIREIYNGGCVVLLFILSIPFNIAMGYYIVSTLIA